VCFAEKQQFYTNIILYSLSFDQTRARRSHENVLKYMKYLLYMYDYTIIFLFIICNLMALLQLKIILWYVQFLKSKMITIEFSVGSRDEVYLNNASYILSCILRHFVLFCWQWNSPFSNKDRVIYISQSRMHQHLIYFRRPMKS
jgi:hypothetical protein